MVPNTSKIIFTLDSEIRITKDDIGYTADMYRYTLDDIIINLCFGFRKNLDP